MNDVVTVAELIDFLERQDPDASASRPAFGRQHAYQTSSARTASGRACSAGSGRSRGTFLGISELVLVGLPYRSALLAGTDVRAASSPTRRGAGTGLRLRRGFGMPLTSTVSGEGDAGASPQTRRCTKA